MGILKRRWIRILLILMMGVGAFYYTWSHLDPFSKICLKAALGDAQAQEQLSVHYSYLGQNGKPEYYKDAFKWARKAAEKKNAMAQFDLGGMYQFGAGVTKDEAESLKWYHKAAENWREDADRGNVEVAFLVLNKSP